MSVLKDITKARAELVMSQPFFASIALRLRLEEKKNLPAIMGTDSVKLYYNPDMIEAEKLTEIELRTIVCHEVLHVALLHSFRKENRDHFLWNVACDYAVNLIIEDTPGLKLADGLLFDRRYAGMSAEAIYDLLPKTMTQQALNGMDKKMPGDVYEYEGSGNADDKSDPYSASKEEMEQQWKIDVSAAANAARMAGTLPSGLERMITKMLAPKIPWQEVLTRFVTSQAKDDYTFKSPNRRFVHAGLYLPTLNNPRLDNIGIIVDTSGSISEEQLNEFASEMQSIMHLYPGTEAEVLYVDTEVANHQTMDAEDFALVPKGGGGTDFAPGFEWFDEHKIDPACIIYFTDGYCNSYPNDRYVNCPVLWVVTSGYEEFSPPFGEVVMLT